MDVKLDRWAAGLRIHERGKNGSRRSAGDWDDQMKLRQFELGRVRKCVTGYGFTG